jgi:hypothetical protein
MTDIEQEMAERFYGFGRWRAPYWFIGPEPGQAKKEDDKLEHRARAWSKCGKPELTDLKEYHDYLEPGLHTREKAGLQSTWKKLLLTLLAYKDHEYKNQSSVVEDRRSYQRLSLGHADGETCLVELSGLPANSSYTIRERERFLPARVRRLRAALTEKLKSPSPGFVVMYGTGSQNHFESIFGSALKQDRVVRVDSTVVVLATHPNTRGITNQYWIALGKSLREQGKK